MSMLKFTLRFIGVVQLFFGLLFVLAPSKIAPALHLHPHQPAWVNWLFVMAGGRFLGYAYGMFVAARDPERNRSWIDSMIVVQSMDWFGTIGYLVAGDVSLRNVTTAAFLPPLFMAGLIAWRPRRGSVAVSEADLSVAQQNVPNNEHRHG